MHHSDYVALHVHSEYSLLDGAIRIDELIEMAGRYKMPAVSITDHGNLFGAVEFYKKASDAGIKPIIGCEVYVAQNSMSERRPDGTKSPYYHLVLLAKNMDGYRNLVTLVTRAYLEGFYYKPRIDMQLLEQYSGGLIGLSACLKGEVPSYLIMNKIDQAREAAIRYRHILGADNFYLEIQDNGIPEQYEINKKLIDLSEDLHIKLVATNDCHYLRKEDHVAHDILLCIQTGKTVNDTNRMKFNTSGLYFKSPEEMKAAFPDNPEAILNTREIAEKCNLTFKLYNNMLPRYHIEGGLKPDEYLEKLATEGLMERFGGHPAEVYTDRYATEMKVIKKMGFPSYFLIVWDFINHARRQNIPVGPGRGSAAGSLIAYCLGITDIDPIKYNLLFERFLNPERISMPDIDVDFCKDRRGEVITYTAEKYGKDHVAQIITFGTMAAKAAVRDVGRALGMPYSEVDKIAKLIPTTLNITLKEALDVEPELKKACERSQEVKNLIDIAMRLEGLCRHASTHAAGVVISPTPLTDYTPLYKHPSEDTIITQFDMGSVEKMGLLKFDFLGLKTLTVIRKTLDYLEAQNINLDIKSVSLEDDKTYALLSSGMTTGVFQLESPGMKDILVKMAPNRFEDLIALVALYRPGPIGSGMIDDFINRKKGKTPVHYDLPQLKGILDETYGVILYQEQVMRIANKLANFTMGQADILRKAMGKKIIHEMDRLKDEFVKGAISNGINEKTASKIFDLMAMFAKYGFNKSHSAAYAYVAYQTAYLKAHYPVEFLAANLSAEDTSDKIVKFIRECGEMNIKILPPDINLSSRHFSIESGAIRFGLEAVKGVGAAAIDSVLEVRNNSLFTSLEDFMTRADSRKVNKKVVESLIKAGALDSIIETRACAVAKLDQLLTGFRTGPSLFDNMIPASNSTASAMSRSTATPEWDEWEKLRFEKQALGFYVSSHPVRKFEREIARIGAVKTSGLENIINNTEVKVVGIASLIKKKPLKDNKGMMCEILLEDDEGSIECLAFNEVLQKSSAFLRKDEIIIVRGKLDVSEKGNKIIVAEITDLSTALLGKFTRFEIDLSLARYNHKMYEKLKNVLNSSKGPLPVHLKLSDGSLEASIVTSYTVSYDPELIREIESIHDKCTITLN